MSNTRNGTRQFDYTSYLTGVYSLCSILDVARLKDIVQGLGEQSARQHLELLAANEELNKLRPAVQKFRELEALIKEKGESQKIDFALLLNVPQKINTGKDAYAHADVVSELINETIQEGEYLSEEDIEITHVPLWKVIREILKQTSAIRVYELESHLASFGVKAARSAIESALTAHKKDFKTEKHDREKFVSLK